MVTNRISIFLGKIRLGRLHSHGRQQKMFLGIIAWENSWHLVTLPLSSFPVKWRLRNKCGNSILMTRHYPDLGSASDWSCRVGNLIQPIRGTTQSWVVMHHQYRISALTSQTSFGGETSAGVAKCRLFSQATGINVHFQPKTKHVIFQLNSI